MSVQKTKIEPKASPKKGGGFQQGRTALGNVAGMVLWGLLWMLNGWFTVQAWGSVVATLGYADYAQPMYGWVFHVLVSLIQGAMWRMGKRDRSVLATLFILGIVDVGSTTIGLKGEVVARLAIIETVTTTSVLTGLAMLLALLPERMIVGHLREVGIIK